MEIQLAHKIKELEIPELIDLLMRLRIEDKDAFEVLRELVEDL
jgi:hypothetical protein